MPQHDWQQPDNRGSDDWAPGDLALCVHGGVWYHEDGTAGVAGPQRGQTLEVKWIEIAEGEDYGDYQGSAMLGFEPWRSNVYWEGSFRKIRPLTKDEADEFVLSLRDDETVTACMNPLRGFVWYTGLTIDKKGVIRRWSNPHPRGC